MVGIDDDRWGQAVTAVVELAPDSVVDEAALREALRGPLAGYKVPKRIVFVDRLQRSPNGKSDYRWAKQFVVDALA